MRKLLTFIVGVFIAQALFASKKITNYNKTDNTINLFSWKFGYATTSYSGNGISETSYTEFFFGPLYYKTEEAVSVGMIIFNFFVLAILCFVVFLYIYRKSYFRTHKG